MNNIISAGGARGVHCILPYMLEAVEGARDILIIKKLVEP